MLAKKNFNSQVFKVAAYSFGQTSGVFGFSRILHAPDSTFIELHAAQIALVAACAHEIENFILILYNQFAIGFLIEAILSTT